jgi:predicted DNA binding CopG/RHH family protein
MKTSTKIHHALNKANQLEKAVKEIMREIEDYDLERLLKKVDAHCLDVQHNLTIAHRLSETHGLSKSKKKKAKGKR